MTFTPHAKLPFKVAPGNFNYNGNTSHVLRINYVTSNKFFGKWLPQRYLIKRKIYFRQCYIDIWVCHSNVMTSRSIVFHGHWRFFRNHCQGLVPPNSTSMTVKYESFFPKVKYASLILKNTNHVPNNRKVQRLLISLGYQYLLSLPSSLIERIREVNLDILKCNNK